MEELQMVDISYSHPQIGIGTIEGVKLIPVNLVTHIAFTKNYQKTFKRFWRIGKQPICTPSWKLNQIVKEGKSLNFN